MTVHERSARSIDRHARSWRGLVYQALAIALLLALIVYLTKNTAASLQAKGVASGFGFLLQPAGFGIGEGVLPYVSSDIYWRAFLAGIDNTVRVAVMAMLATTLIGAALGMGRLSRNALVRGLCIAYVEVFRNIPLLLQLLAWYALLTSLLPGIDEAWQFGGCFYLSKSGLSFPLPIFSAGWPAFDCPVRYPFTIAGGARMTPEFLSLFIGLTVYSSAYLAESIRAGLEAVPRGQVEAAASLGLTHRQIMRRVIVPQAMRVIIPPAANQYSSLIKSSSLAITVGYPDLMSIANTTLNQSGRAVECISLVMLSYLLLSLLLSALMNWINRRTQSWGL
jgi:general L-amino acid transport system permease protein